MDVVGRCQWLISVINFSALKLSGVRSPIENRGEFISLRLLDNFSKLFSRGQYLSLSTVSLSCFIQAQYCHVQMSNKNLIFTEVTKK